MKRDNGRFTNKRGGHHLRIQLSDHFSYTKLLRYTFPSIIMTVFISLYGIMDGIFVSNFAGKTPFAAISLILPFIFAMGSVGFMIGTGGAAIVAKTLGEKRQEKANQTFSMLIAVTGIIGLALTAVGLIIIRPVAIAMGATGSLLENSVLYGNIMLLFQAAFMIQTVFQSMFPVAEKPKLGLALTVTAGTIDILLNALFIIVFKWGIVGAAVSTVIGQLIGSIVPILYFLRRNDSLLRLVKPTFDGKTILKACTNGSSELMTALSSSVTGVLINLQLMRLAGENGIAAYGVILYVNYIFYAVFIGYSTGSAPIISYHYGAENHFELKNLFRKSLIIIGVGSILLTAVAIIFSNPIARFFVGYDPVLLEMSQRAFALYAVSFLMCGFNIFGSAFFTALNNGAISATISFARTLLFQALAIMLLPLIIGLDGVWLAVVAAETLALAVAIFFFIRKKKQYHYG